MSARNRKMSDKHEDFLVELLGGTKSPGSGNQWHRPMDGRHSRFAQTIAFAWDGKSTLGKSIGVSREMWAKAVEQAGGERPMLALRFYANERLTDVDIDLITVEAQDFAELMERSKTLDRIQALLDGYDAYSDPDGREMAPERLSAILRGEDDPLGVV